MAERFESFDQLPDGSNRIDSVKVVTSQFPIGRIGFEHLESDRQQFVARGNNRFSPSSSGFHAVKERAQVTLLAMGNRPS